MDRKAVFATTLTLLLLSMSTLAFNIQPVRSDWTWTETIYIGADGSIEPETAPISTVDNITYILTDNIVGVVLEWSGHECIVIERNNTVVDGAGYTVQGTGIGRGIHLKYGNNITVKNMEIKAFGRGIWISESSNCIISGNSITHNTDGILMFSSDNSISENNITNNNRGIVVEISSNNNNISGNNITANNYRGIWFEYSSNNSVFGNLIANNFGGIVLSHSSGNILSENNIVANTFDGISLYEFSNNNTVSKNNVTNNEFGIWVAESSGNTISHNNFINNINQTYNGAYCVNAWDDGYPSGGNYWSDYEERYPTIGDEYQGENQNIVGSDGIWDSPYVIDENNQDRYPFVNPWTPTPPVVTATLDINPDTLNLRSEGQWITAYIQLPEGYNAEDVDATAILLDGTISPVLDPMYEFVANSSEYLVDYNGDGILERMVKFDKAEVMALLGVGEATLTITGIVNGTKFEGSDSIRVIFPSTGSGGCKGFKK